ncbi:sensor histidine kinase [Pleomorphomonas carboxyditropha]|uniref:histidine kinase n=1 Tax=Pleomorphomonas carboxyditropha TaxID=2023338 RepID=A0A2G9WZU9_9HYPH|nr:ATP-binding protein [Pleomorphomonas carboxyditropha]PIP00258.1 hypothetical protein CJ014_05860 [Pleomorphomonas carboxyditropha]
MVVSPQPTSLTAVSRPARRRGLRRSLFLASAAVLGAIVLVEGAALIGLERLDGLLSEMQRESIADARRMLELSESTSNLSLAARRFRDIGDREDLSQAEMALRDELRRFSTLTQSLPALTTAEPTPSVVPALVQASDRLNAIVTDLAATVAEAIDANAGMRTATQDLALLKSVLLADDGSHPTIAVALSLASAAIASSDSAEVESQQAAFLKLLGHDGRPMALTLLVPLFERRLAVIDVESRQRRLIASADAAARDIARLSRDYSGLLTDASSARQAEIARALRIGKIAAVVIGLAVLATAFVVANAFLRGAIADLTGIADAMRRLAAGDTAAEAPGAGRRDEIGALAAAFGVFKAQVAEREQLQRQLQHAERLEAIGRFTGGIAHDFNNVLTAISANVQLIQETTDAGSPNNQRALRALEATESGSSMVQQLLTFGRRRSLEPAPTDVDAVIDALADLLHDNFGGPIRLETVKEGERAGPLVALIDAGQLENALINLLFNARDAISGEGVIRLAAGPTADGKIRIRVEDNGSGMTPEVLDHVFEPFFTTKQAAQGNGLGLATVYGFVHQSGGRIDLTSQPGQGTVVDIELPRYPPAGGAALA